MSAAAAGGRGHRPGGLVHGMGKDLAEPDWSPLTTDEVTSVLARYDRPDPAARTPAAVVTCAGPWPYRACSSAETAVDVPVPTGLPGPIRDNRTMEMR